MGEQTGTRSHSALRIVAACQTTAEFVAAYARYCERRSLFIATRAPKAIGEIVKFKIDLASGDHVMTGVGRVVETFSDRENRFSRPGMRVEVEKLDASGRRWMEQLRTRSSAAPTPAVVASPTGMFATVEGDPPKPAAVASPTGEFATIHDDPPAPVAAAAAPAAESAPPPVPAASAVPEPVPVVAAPVLPPASESPSAKDKPSAVPVAIGDNLSAGWEIDGLPPALSLPPPRALTPPPIAGEKLAAKNGEKPAAGKNGSASIAKAHEAVTVSGEVDVPPALPPPPTKGRSKRITFPALMFNKPRGIAMPAPSGQVVPKPLALLPSAGQREGKLRPPTAPVAPVEREPGAPVAPLGTPADTEPHVMVPPELETSIAQPIGPAEGTPPPPPALDTTPPPFSDDDLELMDATPEASNVVTSAPEAAARPRRSKGSTTTPPPVWTERTVTQTLAALVGGQPDPGVKEETVHWTNPGFPALKRAGLAEVDIIEEEVPEDPPAAVPVVVGVELSAGLDQTVVSPAPRDRSRLGFVAALVVTAAAALGGGYYLGLRQGVAIEKLPVTEVAAAEQGAAPVAERKAWIAECSDAARTASVVAAEPAPVAEEEELIDTPVAAVEEPIDTRAADDEPTSSKSRAPSPASPQTCFINAMTSPVGATVLIDGRVSGRTPLRSRVSCGRHSLRFEMQNYQAATRSFTVRRGDTEKVSAELTRPRTVLRVESTPGGATVLVNGSSVGVTPLTTTVPGFVSTTVTLSKPGYKTVSKQINPTATSARIGVTFKPAGSISRRR